VAERRKKISQLASVALTEIEALKKGGAGAAYEKAVSTFADLTAKLRQVRIKVARYVRHLKQYAACRDVIKTIEKNLKLGQAVVYRDFVAQYNCNGKKVVNLVFVVVWPKKSPGGVITQQVFKLSHICTNDTHKKQDAFYVAQVFDFHFGKKGDHSDFFKTQGIHEIFLSGDHGSHFSSAQTVYNESTFYEKYDLQIHCFFLCSYHAYNRCDPAGCEPKTICKQYEGEQQGLATAAQIATALNESNYENSFG
jgi:hypothetical protein